MPPLFKREKLAKMTNLTPKKIYYWFSHKLNYDGFNYGDWQKNEHEKYLEAVELYGQNNWNKL